MTITAAKLFYYRLPFYKTMPFNGHKISYRKGLILQLQHSNAQLSYGEIAPLPGFSHETFKQATQQTIALLNKGLDQLPFAQHRYPSVQFALDSALSALPISSQSHSLDTIPLLQGTQDALIHEYLSQHKPPLIKLKVARQPIKQDIQLFNLLADLNSKIKIRCDANQQWSATQASYFFKNINPQHLDYIEEPTPNHQVNLQLAERYQINLGLDESLLDKPFQYHPRIKALVLKPMLLGGLKKLEALINIASQQQLQVHISASFESVIGLQQLRALACRYQKKCALTLGIDTLKFFQPGLLTDPQQITTDLQQLECLWPNH